MTFGLFGSCWNSVIIIPFRVFAASLLLYGHVVAIVPKQSRNKQNSVKLLFRLAFGPLLIWKTISENCIFIIYQTPKNSCSSVFFVSSWNQQRKPQDLTWELICWALDVQQTFTVHPPPPSLQALAKALSGYVVGSLPWMQLQTS